jgi:hypothetical protein
VRSPSLAPWASDGLPLEITEVRKGPIRDRELTEKFENERVEVGKLLVVEDLGG